MKKILFYTVVLIALSILVYIFYPRPIVYNHSLGADGEYKMIAGQIVSSDRIRIIYTDGTETVFSYEDYKAHPVIFEREIASTTGHTIEQIRIFATSTGFDTKRGVLEINNE